MQSIYVVDGECIFHDPGPEMISAILAMHPEFRIESIRPRIGFVPKFQLRRQQDIFLEDSPFEYDPEALTEILNGKVTKNRGTRHSGLDIAYALCLKCLSKCSLCGWDCGINRYRNETGRCGLSSIVYAASPIVNIADESPINPCVVTNLGGCGMHCCYCVDHRLLTPSFLQPLDTKKFWQEVSKLVDGNINAFEFTNPTESLHGIMHILLGAPEDFHLPLVMDCHLYGSRDFYRLADPITDVWLPDLRYGNDECAKSLSGVDGYMKQAADGLASICRQGNKVIVRILVLPGHASCCNEPALELLSAYKDLLWVSLLDQYIPEYKAHLDPYLSRRPSEKEIEQVNNLVKKYGLRNVSECCGEFWD